MKVVLHAKEHRWHKRYTDFFRKGLAKHGIALEITDSEHPVKCDVGILFGPNYWKECERVYDQYLMVSRAFFGEPGDNVAIGWNGLNGRGTFCCHGNPRMGRHDLKFKPWHLHGNYLLLCGQYDLSRCRRWLTMCQWQDYIRDQAVEDVVFRPWPGGTLPLVAQARAATAAIILNSTVGIECLINGIPNISYDEGSPTYAVSGKTIQQRSRPNRQKFFEYLSQCQWHYSEISSGMFWEQLKSPFGPRLCEIKI